MNARFALCKTIWLQCAVTGLVMIGPVALGATPAEGTDTPSATTGSNRVLKSAVQRQLEALGATSAPKQPNVTPVTAAKTPAPTLQQAAQATVSKRKRTSPSYGVSRAGKHTRTRSRTQKHQAAKPRKGLLRQMFSFSRTKQPTLAEQQKPAVQQTASTANAAAKNAQKGQTLQHETPVMDLSATAKQAPSAVAQSKQQTRINSPRPRPRNIIGRLFPANGQSVRGGVRGRPQRTPAPRHLAKSAPTSAEPTATKTTGSRKQPRLLSGFLRRLGRGGPTPAALSSETIIIQKAEPTLAETTSHVPPAPTPLAELKKAEPKKAETLADAPTLAEPVATEVAADNTAGDADDFADPFTDVSEEEADRQENPFGNWKVSAEKLAKVQPKAKAPETIQSVKPAAELPAPIEAKAVAASPKPQPVEKAAAQLAEKAVKQPTEMVAAKKAVTKPAEKLAVAKPQESKQPGRNDRMKLIAERKQQTGFRGFCPVVLRDHRELRDAKSEFSSNCEGTSYHFSSAEAKAKFDAHPEKYAPAKAGQDVILLTSGVDKAVGSLEHAVWYKDRLYLFSTSQSKATFVREPAKFCLDVSKATELTK